jgi:hypothetical protein
LQGIEQSSRLWNAADGAWRDYDSVLASLRDATGKSNRELWTISSGDPGEQLGPALMEAVGLERTIASQDNPELDTQLGAEFRRVHDRLQGLARAVDEPEDRAVFEKAARLLEQAMDAVD